MKKAGRCIFLFFTILILYDSCYAEEKQGGISSAYASNSKETSITTVCHVEYQSRLTGLKMETKPMSSALAQRHKEDLIRDGSATNADVVCK